MSPPASVRTLIVDDEPLARQRLRQLIESVPQFRVVAESANGEEAVRDILRLRPHLVFLDIQMPGLGGFEVIDAVGAARMPVVVFVTAYDAYALKAFDVHAVDYLLKPYSKERFEMALAEALKEIHRRRTAGPGQPLDELLAGLHQDGRIEPRVLVRAAGRVDVVRLADIDWIEAAGNYVELHVGPVCHLLRETMKRMEERLDPDRFMRIHRSVIVNVDRVRSLKPLSTGDYRIRLESGTELTLSRRFRETFLARFPL